MVLFNINHYSTFAYDVFNMNIILRPKSFLVRLTVQPLYHKKGIFFIH